MKTVNIIVQFNVIKYWAIVITARISEKWTIKFINGIIEFDFKLFLFNSSFPVELYSIILVTSLYYLSNLGYRFCELNRLWKCLPFGLIALPGGLTNSEITILVERIRLLHAELSELLRLFSLGYGPILLIYFTFTFSNALLETFLITIYNDSKEYSLLPFIFYLQHIFHMTSILYITSWVIEKKKKIISYLRLVRISEMTVHTKLQIKMFMQQISVYEPNEFTAFGFFNFDLKLTMSILVLLISGISTMLQMKDHPLMLYLKNSLKERNRDVN
ncbi:unnamed protein product [Macrosiphum euphorbiae]|uniref:Gustatory receptor n=1 Tax=Macrosiphum euphorbiae TaxID=13131 RepID=A0AAV0XEF9_9HEMI|nr:unnamed protein product [Macrosiphum euphorbiae]